FQSLYPLLQRLYKVERDLGKDRRFIGLSLFGVGFRLVLVDQVIGYLGGYTAEHRRPGDKPYRFHHRTQSALRCLPTYSSSWTCTWSAMSSGIPFLVPLMPRMLPTAITAVIEYTTGSGSSVPKPSVSQARCRSVK